MTDSILPTSARLKLRITGIDTVGIDTVGIVLRIQALLLPVQTLVFRAALKAAGATREAQTVQDAVVLIPALARPSSRCF